MNLVGLIKTNLNQASYVTITSIMSHKLLFEELKPDELKEIIKNSGIVYLPLGTLEWHEHHLPFGLDALVAHAICKAACKKTSGCVIPPLYFGTDREHEVNGEIFHGMDARAGRILPGSIYYLKYDLFYSLLKAIAENISQQGFKKLVVISQHSGTAQQTAIEKLAQEKIGKLKILVFPGKLFPGGMDHAGKIETSLMMAVDPKLVDTSTLHTPYEAISGDDPRFANRSDGEKQFYAIVDGITKVVSES